MLPVYYKYNGEFAAPYLDENHYYDIEVYENAVCITDVKSKTGADVIKLIDVGVTVNSDFMQSVVINCETENKAYILKGRLYDKKTNSKLYKIYCFGHFGEFFNDNPHSL